MTLAHAPSRAVHQPSKCGTDGVGVNTAACGAAYEDCATFIAENIVRPFALYCADALNSGNEPLPVVLGPGGVFTDRAYSSTNRRY
jgi:hypothetical protein